MLNFIKENSKVEDLYIGKELLNKIIDELKKEIINNKNKFENLYKIDSKYSEQEFSINKIINLIDAYKNEKIKKQNKKNIIAVSYLGNTYITINLCIQSLIKKSGTIILIKDDLLGVNELIVTIFNAILQKNKIANMVRIFNNKTIQEISQIDNEVESIICLGNTRTYYEYLKFGVKKLKYIPYKNIAIYSEEEKFEELKYELYNYAIKNGIEAEFYGEEIEEFIDCVNLSEELENVLVFSSSKEVIQKCKEQIKNAKLFINENPFKDDKLKIEI